MLDQTWAKHPKMDSCPGFLYGTDLLVGVLVTKLAAKSQFKTNPYNVLATHKKNNRNINYTTTLMRTLALKLPKK